MNKINTLFFDVGNICLTNGWDHEKRRKAAEHFSIDYESLEEEHQKIFKDFEKGKVSLDDYLSAVIFNQDREFTKSDFIDFMKAQSNPYEENLDIIRKIQESKKYFVAAINNESLELNKYRISTFELNKIFNAIFSSAFVYMRKPEPEIFNLALNVLSKKPEQCCFIDDRDENIESAKEVGLNVIHVPKPKMLKEKLIEYQII